MLLTHLRKELQQAAPSFFALLFFVLVGCAGFTWFYFCVLHPTWDFEAAEFGWRVAAVAGVAALLALGDIALPEIREGNASLVTRLPGALGPSFLARAVVLVGGTAYVTAFGFGVTVGTCATIGDRLMFGTSLESTLATGGGVVGAAILGAFWTLTLTCGLRRGALALPAALLIATVIVGPATLALREVGARPKTGDHSFVLAVLAVAAAGAGWIAFRGTFRWSRGPLSGAWRGIVALLLLSTPIPALAGLRIHQWTSIDEDDDFQILYGLIGADARRAYLSATRGWDDIFDQTVHLVVDLERGTAAPLDGPVAPAGWALDFYASGFDYGTHPIVMVSDDRGWSFVDTETGTSLYRAPESLSWVGLPVKFRERLLSTIHRTTPMKFADGRPAWRVRGELHALGTGGSIEAIEIPDDFVISRGIGHWLFGLDRRILDIHTMEFVVDEPSHGDEPRVLAISNEGRLWNRPPPGEPRFEEGYAWVDATDGTERLLRFPNGTPILRTSYRLWDSGSRTRDGRIVLGSYSRELRVGRNALLLDPRTAIATPIGPSGGSVLAVDEDDTFYAIAGDGGQLVRFHPDSDDVEVLFPKPR